MAKKRQAREQQDSTKDLVPRETLITLDVICTLTDHHQLVAVTDWPGRVFGQESAFAYEQTPLTRSQYTLEVPYYVDSEGNFQGFPPNNHFPELPYVKDGDERKQISMRDIATFTFAYFKKRFFIFSQDPSKKYSFVEMQVYPSHKRHCDKLVNAFRMKGFVYKESDP